MDLLILFCSVICTDCMCFFINQYSSSNVTLFHSIYKCTYLYWCYLSIFNRYISIFQVSAAVLIDFPFFLIFEWMIYIFIDQITENLCMFLHSIWEKVSLRNREILVWSKLCCQWHGVCPLVDDSDSTLIMTRLSEV